MPQVGLHGHKHGMTHLITKQQFLWHLLGQNQQCHKKETRQNPSFIVNQKVYITSNRLKEAQTSKWSKRNMIYKIPTTR